jgi:hypothetical protein
MSAKVTPEVEDLLGQYAIALAAAYMAGTDTEFRLISKLIGELPPTLELRVTLMAEKLLKGGNGEQYSHSPYYTV